MKQDKRFENIKLEFGELNLNRPAFLETLAASIHKGMAELIPQIYSMPDYRSWDDIWQIRTKDN